VAVLAHGSQEHIAVSKKHNISRVYIKSDFIKGNLIKIKFMFI